MLLAREGEEIGAPLAAVLRPCEIPGRQTANIDAADGIRGQGCMTTARDGSWITQHPARLCHRGRQAEATKSGNQSGLAKRHTPSRTSDGALTNRLLDVGSLAGCWQEVSDQLVEDE